ncbi:MAG: AAA family ATPase, partial [Desulfobacterales bacterium]|nr:AAA family ATPase [Desulfobacterales bacterium]
MKLGEFEANDVNFEKNFVGFPLILKELKDIVKYLEYLTKLDQAGKQDQRRMLMQSECGSLFLGGSGTGKTYALHCVVNEAKKIGYYPVDGSRMLKKDRVASEDVGDFFDQCREEAKEAPLVIAYDDAKQLLGLSSEVRETMRETGGRDDGENPMLEELRRQMDRLAEFDHPAYIIITSIAGLSEIDEQIVRR